MLTAVTLSCGGGSKTPVQPTPIITVSSISPNSGPTIGGTPVTVTGDNFVAGAVLNIGGTLASNVTVLDSGTIAATTGPRMSGAADVRVFSGGGVGLLSAGYTYIEVANVPPVISSVTAQGSKYVNQPARIADLDEEISVAVTVTDAETAIDQLSFVWSAEQSAGTFTGDGRAVRWRAPRDVARTPVSYVLTVTVVEKYQVLDELGAVVTKEHRVPGTVTVRVHNARKEVSDLAGEFLRDFSNSSVSPESAVRNFSDSCGGKFAEIEDIRSNRAAYTIISSVIGTDPAVKIGFKGACTDFRPHAADACVSVSCQWTSTVKASGKRETSGGTCYLTAIYEATRWQLCDSDYNERFRTGLRFD